MKSQPSALAGLSLGSRCLAVENRSGVLGPLCVLGQVINFSGPRFVSSHEEDKDACSVEQSEDEMLSYLALTQHSVLHVGSVS